MKDKKLFKSFKFEVKEVKEDERLVVARVSKQAVDLDKDVVVLSGMTFKERIPLLWSHQHSSPPIGEVVSLNVVEDDLIAKIKYVEPEVYSFGDTIYKLTLKGLINEFSIGFFPDWNTVTYKEDVRYINNSLLFEVSSVNFGANPYTTVLAKAVEDGIIDEVEMKEAELYLNTIKEEVKDEYDDLLKELDTEDNFEQNIVRKCSDCGSDLICPICNQTHKSTNDFEWLLSDLETPSPDPKEETAKSILKSL
jgi:HK97 family phage prohead protease